MHPSLNILERISIGYRKCEDDSCSPFIVGLSDVFEPFLTSCVPNLQFIPSITDSHCFDFKIDANGRHIGIFKSILTKSSNQVSLSNSRITDDYDFSQNIKLLAFLLLCHMFDYYYNHHKQNKMNNQSLQFSSQAIKQAQSINTNINPQLQENQNKYGNFPNPSTYELNQSLFSLKLLYSQPEYSVLSQPNYLYFGGIYKGMKHGLGVQLTKDTTYEGQFSLDYKTGKGYQKFPNGAIYFGDFLNNRTHGQGSLKFGSEYYVGDFQNGSMQGDGMWRNSQGDKYIGQWKANKAHGYGIYITTISHYQGFFSKFVKHGQGVQHFTNGDYYKGMYENGHPHGFGQYIWKDGSNYKGDFVKGLREGSGVWTNQNGDKYEGQFKKDKKNGKGTFTWVNGNLYKGQFVDDRREGEGEMFWNDGSNYKGDWKKGAPNGLGTFKMKGEKPKSGIFQNNKLVREFKSPQQQHKHVTKKQPLILSIIPQLNSKRANVNKTFRSRDVKTKGTADTSNIGGHYFRR